jgi:hypothetical protein
MIIIFISYFIGALLDLLVLLLSTATLAIPNWLLQGMSDIFSGTAKLQFLLPMYPDPSLTGIASVAGIMTIVGWLLILIYAMWVLIILIWAIKFIVGILPWSTQNVKTPIDK